jgi:phage terminase small subunit
MASIIAYGDGLNTKFGIPSNTGIVVVTVDGVQITPAQITNDYVLLTTAPAYGAVVVIDYATASGSQEVIPENLDTKFRDAFESYTPGVKWAETEAWDAIKGIGRDAGPEGQLEVESAAIDKLKAQIETRKAAGFNTQLLEAELVKMRDRQGVLQSEIRLRKSAAEAQAGQARAAQQLAAWDQAGGQYANTAQQREAELRQSLGSAGVDTLELVRRDYADETAAAAAAAAW